MIAQFIAELTAIQYAVIVYLVIYLLIYGVQYHLLALNGYLTGRGISNNVAGVTMNILGYASIVMCLYWFV
jgi:hypothetical protein